MHNELSFGGAQNDQKHILVVAALLVAALMIGAALPLYVAAVGEGAGRLAAIPTLVFLCFLFVYSRKSLLLLIILFRASADIVFDTSKLLIGGQEIGIGALVNAFVLAVAILLVFEKPETIPARRVAIMWGGFLFTAFFSAAVSPVKVDALRTYLALLSYLAMFASAFYFVRSPGEFRSCVRIVVLSSVLPALYVMVEVATGGGHRIDGFRIQSTFSHPNIFGFYLTLIISLLLYLGNSGAQKKTIAFRLGMGAYMFYLIGLLLLTQARGAWISCFLVFVVYGLVFERRYLALLMVLPLIALLIPGVQDRVLDLTSGNNIHNQYEKLNSFAWRRLMWESSLQWMKPDHYWLGYGMGSFRFYSPTFFPLAGTFNPGAHSVIVQLIFEMGAIGLAAFLWTFGYLLASLRPLFLIDKMAAVVIMTLLVEYLVMCVGDNMLENLSFNWYLWFVAGAALALSLSADRVGRSRESPPPMQAGTTGMPRGLRTRAASAVTRGG